MIDPNKILNALLREDLNEEKGFILFFIWYNIHNLIRIAIECKDRKISLAWLGENYEKIIPLGFPLSAISR